jgi:sugar lactone lactonase YvrE
MRRVVALLAVLLGVWASAAQAGSGGDRMIALPDAFQPEGIAIDGDQFYVGSIPSGAIYRGNLRTGAGSVFVPGATGRSAIGIDVARGLVFAAGGETGKAFVYSAATGELEAELVFTTSDSFVNDVVVTRDAAWFTDSLSAVLYRVSLDGDGPPTQADVRTVNLTGDFELQDGFNTNGIDETQNGKQLVIVQSNTGLLFTVDPDTGEASTIDLGGATLVNGDGILLHGRRLYVVQNRDNRIAVVKVDGKLTRGRVVDEITSSEFDVPTTIAESGPWLYAVNARFGTPPASDTKYWITQVRR